MDLAKRTTPINGIGMASKWDRQGFWWDRRFSFVLCFPLVGGIKPRGQLSRRKLRGSGLATPIARSGLICADRKIVIRQQYAGAKTGSEESVLILLEIEAKIGVNEVGRRRFVARVAGAAGEIPLYRRRSGFAAARSEYLGTMPLMLLLFLRRVRPCRALRRQTEYRSEIFLCDRKRRHRHHPRRGFAPFQTRHVVVLAGG